MNNALKIVEIKIGDKEYPPLLLEISNPPKVLYCIGDISLLKTKCLGVVGSREPSRYGEDTTHRFVYEIASQGITIVSGLAKGIDSVAHKTALDMGGKTIAVLGCGIDKIYPQENAYLYNRIYKEGLVVSEYGEGVKPNGYQFPERNRIVSGLCEGILVTEARVKSGSIITAEIAVEQGRNIYAVPSSINSPRGEGSNKLLKRYPHALTLSPEEIIAELGLTAVRTKPSNMQLDYTEGVILEALTYKPLHFDELMALTGLSTAQLNALLTRLELFEIIKKYENNTYGV
ncbi:MAG: DNA-processing protein DprA [Firmicutes bacterium]|nr:DNA-processing protein DprA [Bacillota bacterium]